MNLDSGAAYFFIVQVQPRQETGENYGAFSGVMCHSVTLMLRVKLRNIGLK